MNSNFLAPAYDLKTICSLVAHIKERGIKTADDDEASGIALDVLVNGFDVSPDTIHLHVRSAVLYGLVNADNDEVILTSLGRSTMDARSLTQAVFAVPLFKAIIEKYKGTDPDDALLPAIIANYGFSAAHAARTASIFKRSVDYANGRPVKKFRGCATTSPGRKIESPQPKPCVEAAPPVAPDGILANIIGWMPPLGTRWSIDHRVRWLRAIISAIDVHYEPEADEYVEVYATPVK